MVFSKSLIMAMGMIPQVFATPISLGSSLLTRGTKTPILVPFEANGFVNITVGSQKSPLLISWDTGTDRIWVPNSNVTCVLCIGKDKDCTNDTTSCKKLGTFDPLNSTSFVDLHQEWSVQYDWGNADLGWLGKDQLSIGGLDEEAATVQDLEFAVADYAYDQPILGVGVNSSYSGNLPTKLKDQGYITKAAYSLWHDSLNAETGSFLLGGLDEAKYEGDLVSVPVIHLVGNSSVLPTTIILDGEILAYNVKGLIHTGSPQLFVTPPVLANLTTKLGGSLDSWDGSLFSIPCEQPDYTFEFVFGDATIAIPLSEFIVKYEPTGLCYLNIGRHRDFLIGIQVQKYAYWVFDQDDQTISIAKPTFSNDSKIVSL